VASGPSYMHVAIFWEPDRPLTFEEFQMPERGQGPHQDQRSHLSPSLLSALDLGGLGGFS
jgi:hypothetical protein